MVRIYRFLFLLFLCSCSVGEEDPNGAFDGLYSSIGPNYKFTLDPVKYQQLDFNRKDPSLCQVAFEIKSVKRIASELIIEVVRPKSCTGTYELVWDGKWQESSPRRMQIYLTGLFNSCSLGSETEVDVVVIDLKKSIREAPTDLFTIYLREHCNFRDFNCVGNCDLKTPD